MRFVWRIGSGARQSFDSDFHDGIDRVLVWVCLPSIDLTGHNQAFGLDQRYYHVALYGVQLISLERILLLQGQMGLSDLDFAMNWIQNSFVIDCEIKDPIISRSFYDCRFFIQLEHIDAVSFEEV